MMFLLQLIPMAVFIALPTVYVRLAARLVRRCTVTWHHAVLYALLFVGVALVGRTAAWLSASWLPPLLEIAVAVVLNIAVGAWFLRTRARTSSGQVVGWVGGAQISGVTVALMGVTGLALLTVMNAIWAPRP